MPNSTALLAVQGVLYPTINVPAVTSLAPVFDEVPEGQPRPYVEIEHAEETPSNTFGKHGREVRVQLGIYSEQPGNREVELIVEQLNILLDSQPLPDPVGWHVDQSDYELSTLDKDFDVAGLRKLTVQYLFVLEEV